MALWEGNTSEEAACKNQRPDGRSSSSSRSTSGRTSSSALCISLLPSSPPPGSTSSPQSADVKSSSSHREGPSFPRQSHDSSASFSASLVHSHCVIPPQPPSTRPETTSPAAAATARAYNDPAPLRLSHARGPHISLVPANGAYPSPEEAAPSSVSLTANRHHVSLTSRGGGGANDTTGGLLSSRGSTPSSSAPSVLLCSTSEGSVHSTNNTSSPSFGASTISPPSEKGGRCCYGAAPAAAAPSVSSTDDLRSHTTNDRSLFPDSRLVRSDLAGARQQPPPPQPAGEGDSAWTCSHRGAQFSAHHLTTVVTNELSHPSQSTNSLSSMSLPSSPSMEHPNPGAGGGGGRGMSRPFFTPSSTAHGSSSSSSPTGKNTFTAGAVQAGTGIPSHALSSPSAGGSPSSAQPLPQGGGGKNDDELGFLGCGEGCSGGDVVREDEDEYAQDEAEREHFASVRQAFELYEQDALLEVARIERHLRRLGPEDMVLLREPIDERIDQLKEAIAVNQAFINFMLVASENSNMQPGGEGGYGPSPPSCFDEEDDRGRGQGSGGDGGSQSGCCPPGQTKKEEKELMDNGSRKGGERQGETSRGAPLPDLKGQERTEDMGETRPCQDAWGRQEEKEREERECRDDASTGGGGERGGGGEGGSGGGGSGVKKRKKKKKKQPSKLARGGSEGGGMSSEGADHSMSTPSTPQHGDRGLRNSTDSLLHDCQHAAEGRGVQGGGSGPQYPAFPPDIDHEKLMRNMSKVRSTLRQFVRDWSEEGEEERQAAYGPLLQALEAKLPIRDPSRPPRVLCPGSGLGRLPFEVSRRGYACQGNEFSYFMLIGSDFILNHAIETKSCPIQPYCLSTSNRRGRFDHLQTVWIPDVSPSDHIRPDTDFSMCAGEFVEVYGCTSPNDSLVGQGRPDNPCGKPFDAVLTSYFLDTARNVLLYIRTIAKILSPGGLWANIGPLLYHYAEMPNEMSIELAWDELQDAIKIWFDIEKVEWHDAYYTSNPRSMMQVQYHCVYFVAIRNNTPPPDVRALPDSF